MKEGIFLKKLLIYLVDPVHTYTRSQYNWMIPLNCLNIASYTQAEYGDRVKFQIFKFPELAIHAIKENPPDILGVSNYLWNSELSKMLLQYAKTISPEIITVMGGPNVIESQKFMTSFLKNTPCDYYVSGAGEHPFRSLVAGVLENERSLSCLDEATGVHGIWYLHPDNVKAKLLPIKHRIENIDEIPSPF